MLFIVLLFARDASAYLMQSADAETEAPGAAVYPILSALLPQGEALQVQPGMAPRFVTASASMPQRLGPVSMSGALTKPQRVNLRNREYNKRYKSEMRTRTNNVLEAVDKGDYETAVTLLSKAFAIIDKNVKRNIVHRNTAARKKSALHLKVKKLEPEGSRAGSPAMLDELETVLPADADLDAVLAEEDDLDEDAPARAGSPVMMAEDVATLEMALEAAQDTAQLLGALRDSVDMPVSNIVLPASIPQNIAVPATAQTFASRVRASPMMSAAVDEVMDALKSMTLLEASELVKAIEETFDVDASVGGGMMMAAPMAGGAVAGGEAAAAEEKTEFDLVLDSFPADKKIAVLKIVRELTGLGLKDAKDMVEKAPCTLKEGASKAECDEAKAKLEEAGAKVDLK
jgi:large subunit ribosomal protein L7/L12